MLYLSHLLNNKVLDSADNVIGRLRDLVIYPKNGEYAAVKYLMVEGKKKKIMYIPYDYVDNFSKEEISFKTLMRKIDFEKHVSSRAVLLDKDIMDQQIVDISGARVVRVNDLRMGNFNGKMCVLGIDVSPRGLLRRLGLEWLDVFNLLKVNLIDFRMAQPVHRALKLNTVSDELTRLHPADLANIIEDLSIKHGGSLVESLDEKSAAKVLEEIEPGLQKILVKYLGPDKASGILSQMSVDEVVDLMKLLPRHEARQFLSHLRSAKMKTVEKLLLYPDDTAGGLMTVDYLAVRPSATVKHVIDEIRRHSDSFRSLLYVYVTDDENCFKGVVSLRKLLVTPHEKKMSEITDSRNFHEDSTLKIEDDIDEIMEVMTKYDLYTAAVLDKGRKVVGVVSIDDVMRHLVPNA